MKIYSFVFILFLIAFSSSTFAQLEIGIGFGTSEYGGDLADTPFILSETKPGGSLFGAYSLSDKFAVKGIFGIQKISGADSNKDSSLERNLSFENTIIDFSVVGNYSLFADGDHIVNPYIFAGFGVFKHNPKADLDGKMFALQPLGTEGQGMSGYDDKYKLVDLSIPFGIGVKYEVQDDLYAYIDVRANKTITDYLDDVGSKYFANPSELLVHNGETAYQLAYKSNGKKGWPTDYAALNDERLRKIYKRTTSEGKDDWYYLFTIGGSYKIFSNSKKRSQIWRNRKRVPYKN